jgi:hypothetical protein
LYARQGGSDSWLFLSLAERARESEAYEVAMATWPVVDVATDYFLVGGRDRTVLQTLLVAARDTCCDYRQTQNLVAVGIAYALAGAKPGKGERAMLRTIIERNAVFQEKGWQPCPGRKIEKD